MICHCCCPCRFAGTACCALATGADVALHRALSALHLEGRLPALHSLTVGWGFGGSALQTLATGSEFLTELTTGVGAEVSDWLLASMAASCPHLRALRLQFATVTDAGTLPVPPCDFAIAIHDCNGPNNIIVSANKFSEPLPVKQDGVAADMITRGRESTANQCSGACGRRVQF